MKTGNLASVISKKLPHYTVPMFKEREDHYVVADLVDGQTLLILSDPEMTSHGTQVYVLASSGISGWIHVDSIKLYTDELQ